MKMLPCRARLRIRVLIVLALCQVSASTKPIISPSEQQIVINEGEPLEISCTGSTPIEFVYPHKTGKLDYTSPPKTSNDEENGVYKYVFQRPKTVFGDTGWYGCADHNIDFYGDTNPNYDSEVNWLYVFVKSDTNLFVEADTYAHLNAFPGDKVVIPCRTTSPDLVPILSENNEDELKEVKLSKLDGSFDPKSGFKLWFPILSDTNWYRCSIEKDGEEHAVNYVLSVHMPGKKDIVLRPAHSDKYYQVESGSYVQWVVDVYAEDPKPQLQWFKNGWKIIESAKYFVNISNHGIILKIISLDVWDTGNYTLEAKNDYTIKKLNFTLNVIGIEIFV